MSHLPSLANLNVQSIGPNAGGQELVERAAAIRHLQQEQARLQRELDAALEAAGNEESELQSEYDKLKSDLKGKSAADLLTDENLHTKMERFTELHKQLEARRKENDAANESITHERRLASLKIFTTRDAKEDKEALEKLPTTVKVTTEASSPNYMFLPLDEDEAIQTDRTWETPAKERSSLFNTVLWIPLLHWSKRMIPSKGGSNLSEERTKMMVAEDGSFLFNTAPKRTSSGHRVPIGVQLLVEREGLMLDESWGLPSSLQHVHKIPTIEDEEHSSNGTYIERINCSILKAFDHMIKGTGDDKGVDGATISRAAFNWVGYRYDGVPMLSKLSKPPETVMNPGVRRRPTSFIDGAKVGMEIWDRNDADGNPLRAPAAYSEQGLNNLHLGSRWQYKTTTDERSEKEREEQMKTFASIHCNVEIYLKAQKGDKEFYLTYCMRGDKRFDDKTKMYQTILSLKSITGEEIVGNFPTTKAIGLAAPIYFSYKLGDSPYLAIAQYTMLRRGTSPDGIQIQPKNHAEAIKHMERRWQRRKADGGSTETNYSEFEIGDVVFWDHVPDLYAFCDGKGSNYPYFSARAPPFNEKLSALNERIGWDSFGWSRASDESWTWNHPNKGSWLAAIKITIDANDVFAKKRAEARKEKLAELDTLSKSTYSGLHKNLQ